MIKEKKDGAYASWRRLRGKDGRGRRQLNLQSMIHPHLKMVIKVRVKARTS